MPEIIYLASPYSDPSPVVREHRYQSACRAAAHLMQQGHIVYSPIAHMHPIATLCDLPTGWDYWRRIDEAFLAVCAKLCVLMLHGWEESAGVQAEIQIMSQAGKSVQYVRMDDLMDDLSDCVGGPMEPRKGAAV
jgi:hypothetical protein